VDQAVLELKWKASAEELRREYTSSLDRASETNKSCVRSYKRLVRSSSLRIRSLDYYKMRANPIDDTMEVLRQLSPVLGQRTDSLWYWHLLSEDQRESTKLIKLLASAKAHVGYRREIRLPPPAADKLAGEILMGQVIYPDGGYSTFGLNPVDLYRHVLVCGMTGAGKTNLVLHLLTELGKLGVPFLVFDWKSEYRQLLVSKENKNVKVIRIGDPDCEFRFNPLIPPPGVHPKHWLALIIDVIKHAFYVAHGPEYFFRKGIDKLYSSFGVYHGKSLYPTFSDLERLLAKEYVKGREQLWMSSTKRVLASLTFSGLLGEVLNVREQSDLVDLFSTPTIVELDNLASLERSFLTESLLLWLYHLRKAQGETKELRHVTVLEEAHHVLSEKREFVSGEETVIETLVRMVREFGEGVIAVDQEPSKLSRSILANTSCKVCFNLGSGRDVRTMSEAMSLTSRERESIDLLNTGYGIVKMKNRFKQPICVKFPLVETRRETQ
jgi:DNA helicase HerA-like ATPase